MPDLRNIARSLGREVSGRQVVAPRPRSLCDCSFAIHKSSPDAPDGFVCHSHAGDDWKVCRDHVNERLGTTPKAKEAKPNPKTVEAIYDYTDEAGELLLFQVVRYRPEVPVGRPDENGGWVWSIGEARRVLYRLPEIVEALASERPIFIAEGEKPLMHCSSSASSQRATQAAQKSGSTSILLR